MFWPSSSSDLPDPPRRGSAWLVLSILGLCAVYFAAGKLGLSLAILHPSATAVWPPTGIAIAALLILGTPVWPGIFLGAFLVNATTHGTLLTSLGIAAGNTLEGVVGALLVNRFAGGRAAFEDAWKVFGFALLAGLVSPLLSATIGLATLIAGGLAEMRGSGDVWLTWWLGDAVGALVVSPFLLSWAAAPRPRWNLRRMVELTLLLLCLLLVAAVVFGEPFHGVTRGHPLAFLCLPVVLWPAFRFTQREAATAALLVATIAIARTAQGRGAFASDDPNTSLLYLQSFLGVLTVTAMSVGAVVTEYRRTQAELRRRTDELRASNDELQQFAHVASHDLQEPLRMVSSYVQLLALRCETQLGAQAQEYVRQALAGAGRMRELIDGLLAYARLETGDTAFGRVDCREALRRALDNLQLSIQESGAVVTHGPLPEVYADATQLTQLFQNLVGNAIKFRRPGVPPQIRIESRPYGRNRLITVRDNGIGIEAPYFERIFLIFQRLHGREDYAGTGIGLAVCKKIVERHGGKIWVDSRPEQGSVFSFTLPGMPETDAQT